MAEDYQSVRRKIIDIINQNTEFQHKYLSNRDITSEDSYNCLYSPWHGMKELLLKYNYQKFFPRKNVTPCIPKSQNWLRQSDFFQDYNDTTDQITLIFGYDAVA